MSRPLVSAATVSGLTASPDFHGKEEKQTPPTVESLIEAVRQKFAEQKELLAERAKNEENDKKYKYRRGGTVVAATRLRDKEREFESMLKDVPVGFRLVPVLYTKVEGHKNAAVQDEYNDYIRPNFLRFLADNHTRELKKLGICNHGIERMRQGLDPADAQGRFYHTSIDHIVERSGSGLWAQRLEKDPLRKDEKHPCHPVNHFGNFIFLSEQVHLYKNALNSAQGIGDIKQGESKWLLMMVPERNNTFSGFVCPPQPEGHPLRGLNWRVMDLEHKIAHAGFVANQAGALLHSVKANPIAGGMITSFESVAERQNKTVANLSAEQLAAEKAEGKIEGKERLLDIFNATLAYSEKLHKKVEQLVRPALSDAAKSLEDTFREAQTPSDSPDKSAKKISIFKQFYHGARVKKLRSLSAQFPFEEAAQLQSMFTRMDAFIEQHDDEREQLRRIASARNNPPAPQSPTSPTPDTPSPKALDAAVTTHRKHKF